MATGRRKEREKIHREKQSVAMCFNEKNNVSRLNHSFNLTGRHKKSAPSNTQPHREKRTVRDTRIHAPE